MRDVDESAPAPSEAEPESWSARITGFFEAARRLLATRSEIFRAELGAKAGSFGRGLAALLLAAAFGGMALFLFTAWIAAIFTKLLGGPIAGILAAFGLYIAIAAVGVILGVKSLSRVKPMEFPVTGRELRKDWDTLRAAVSPPPPPAPPEVPAPSNSPAGHSHDDLEARFRAGSE